MQLMSGFPALMQPVQNTLFTIQAGQPKSAHDHKDHDGHQQAAVQMKKNSPGFTGRNGPI